MPSCLLTFRMDDGSTWEAEMSFPESSYDGLGILEAFQNHSAAGSTRVIGIRPLGAPVAAGGSDLKPWSDEWIEREVRAGRIHARPGESYAAVRRRLTPK